MDNESIFFRIKNELFLSALAMVIGTIERRTIRPILGHLYLECSDEGLTLIASNIENQISFQISGDTEGLEIGQSGKTTVPAFKLHEACRNFPASSILDFELHEQYLNLENDSSHFRFTTLPAEDFPFMSRSKVKPWAKLTCSVFRTSLQGAAISMANNDSNPSRNGVIVSHSEDNFSFVSSDGCRASKVSLNEPSISKEAVLLHLPRRGVHELIRILGRISQESDVILNLADGQLEVGFPSGMIILKLTDCEIPSFDYIFAQKTEHEVILQASAMKTAINQVMVLADSLHPRIDLKFSKNWVKLSASNTSNEIAETSIPTESSQLDSNFSFRADFLLDICAFFESNHLKIRFTDSRHGIYFFPNDFHLDYIYLVMPLMV